MYCPLSGAHVTVQKNCAFCPSRSFCRRTHWLKSAVQSRLASRLNGIGTHEPLALSRRWRLFVGTPFPVSVNVCPQFRNPSAWTRWNSVSVVFSVWPRLGSVQPSAASHGWVPSEPPSSDAPPVEPTMLKTSRLTIVKPVFGNRTR